jgi:hypothetical protein
MKMKALIRIMTIKGVIETGKPILIFPYEKANWGLVNYCSYTGHGEGDYQIILKNSRPIREDELVKFARNDEIYGYNLNTELQIIKRAKYQKMVDMWYKKEN